MSRVLTEQAPVVPKKKRWNAFLFIALGFAFWFIFVSLAKIVMKCAPAFQCSVTDLTISTPLTWPDSFILLTTLVIAIWAARRVVFPPDD